jgi:NAD(P)-dependent dehydrogenase (short-subunit alcohol dehydrogenase family)
VKRDLCRRPLAKEISMNVEGKVIIITGAARGIGQEYARYLAGLGARMVIADINDCAHNLGDFSLHSLHDLVAS